MKKINIILIIVLIFLSGCNPNIGTGNDREDSDTTADSTTIDDFSLISRKSGTFDNTFDGDGRIKFDSAGDFIELDDLVLDSSDNIYVVGNRIIDEFSVAKYKPDGSLDTSFGDNGYYREEFPGITYRYHNEKIYISPDENNIYIVCDLSEIANACYIFRLTIDGFFDVNFAGTGWIKENTEICSLTFDEAQNIYAAGYKNFTVQENTLTVCKYLKTGILSTDFADEGYFFYADILARARAIIYSASKLYIAGETDEHPSRMLLLCIDDTGSINGEFNSGEPIIDSSVQYDFIAQHMRIDDSQNLNVAGYDQFFIRLWKIPSSGNQDSDFGVDGTIFLTNFEDMIKGYTCAKINVDNQGNILLTRAHNYWQTQYKVQELFVWKISPSGEAVGIIYEEIPEPDSYFIYSSEIDSTGNLYIVGSIGDEKSSTPFLWKCLTD